MRFIGNHFGSSNQPHHVPVHHAPDDNEVHIDDIDHEMLGSGDVADGSDTDDRVVYAGHGRATGGELSGLAGMLVDAVARAPRNTASTPRDTARGDAARGDATWQAPGHAVGDEDEVRLNEIVSLSTRQQDRVPLTVQLAIAQIRPPVRERLALPSRGLSSSIYK